MTYKEAKTISIKAKIHKRQKNKIKSSQKLDITLRLKIRKSYSK